MSLENSMILSHYIKVTEFLGRVLGPDYEIALHDLSDKNHSLVAIANNHVSGREVGAPLSNVALQMITDDSYQAAEYRLHYRGFSQDGKRLRSSTKFIKNNAGELIGLLCINFDDQRYVELSDRLLSLCHPDAFVETNFQFDENAILRRPVISRTPVSDADSQETLQNSADNVTKETTRNTILNLGLSASRLTAEEKMAVVEEMNAGGAFLLKGAVKEAAEALDCSCATIYRYLSKLRNKDV